MIRVLLDGCLNINLALIILLFTQDRFLLIATSYAKVFGGSSDVMSRCWVCFVGWHLICTVFIIQYVCNKISAMVFCKQN